MVDFNDIITILGSEKEKNEKVCKYCFQGLALVLA
jgi:hypothetical protein